MVWFTKVCLIFYSCFTNLAFFFDKQDTAAGSAISDLARPFQFQTQLECCENIGKTYDLDKNCTGIVVITVIAWKCCFFLEIIKEWDCNWLVSWCFTKTELAKDGAGGGWNHMFFASFPGWRDPHLLRFWTDWLYNKLLVLSSEPTNSEVHIVILCYSVNLPYTSKKSMFCSICNMNSSKWP